MSISKMFKALLAPPSTLDRPANYYKDLGYVVMLGSSQPILGAIAIIIVKQILDGSNQQVALIQAGSMAGLLLSLFYTRYLASHKPQKDYALPQSLGWIAIIASGFINTSTGFSVLIFITLALFHISSPSQGVLYQQIYHPKIRGNVLAKVKQWQLLVAVSLSLFLGHMIESSPNSYAPAYWLVGGIGLIACFFFMTIETDGKVGDSYGKSKLGEFLSILVRDRRFSLFMLFQFLLGIANISGIAVFQVFINDSQYLALPPDKAAFIAGVLPPLAMFFSIRLWGKIFDKINIVSFRVITSTVMGIGFLIYPILGFWGAMIGTIIWGIGRGGGQLAWSIGVLDFAPKEKASMYLSIHTFLTGVRGVIAPFLGVWLIDSHISPQNLFFIVSALIFLSAILTKAFVKVPDQRH